jgi:hypothetical protein
LRIFNKGVEVEEDFAHGGNEGAFVASILQSNCIIKQGLVEDF